MSSPIPLTEPICGKTVHDALTLQAKARGESIAVEYGGRNFTFAQLDDFSRRFGSSLDQLGVSWGDRVGIMLPNCPEFLIAFFGTMLAGTTAVPFNAYATTTEIEHVARHCGIKAIVLRPKALADVVAATKKIEGVEQWIVAGDGCDGAERMAAMIGRGNPAHELREVQPEETALLGYGDNAGVESKGRMFSHTSILSAVAALAQMRPKEIPSRMLCAGPPYSTFNLVSVMLETIARGGTLILHRKFETEAVIEALEREEITHFSGTPMMFEQVLSHASSKKATFPKLIRCDCFGGALSMEIRKQFRERFGVDITMCHGVPESAGLLCCYPVGMLVKSSSVGVPLPGMELKLTDDTGEEVLIGDSGDLQATGPSLMKGYWNDSEATTKVLHDGWLRTGDRGHCDQHGYFFIHSVGDEL